MLRFPKRGLALAALGAAVFLLARVDWLGQRPRYAGYEIDPVGIGNHEARRGDYPLAAAAYERALVRAPDDRLALSHHGSLHLDVGHFSEAEDLFHRTLALDPSDARTENKLGLCYFEQGRWQEAGRAFERAVSLEPAFALAWANRGRAMERQERDVEARSAFAEARRLLGAEAFAELMAAR
jgi:Flp pilus assembly protein TadD